jgi:hypothetical protein
VGINSSVFTSFLLAIFSQYYLRKCAAPAAPPSPPAHAARCRYKATWFRKYNFLVSAALDGGTQVMVRRGAVVSAGPGLRSIRADLRLVVRGRRRGRHGAAVPELGAGEPPSLRPSFVLLTEFARAEPWVQPQ